jgi:hypothetical protein
MTRAFGLTQLFPIPSLEFVLSSSLSSVWFWSSFLFLLHTCRQIICKRKKMAGRAVLAAAALFCAFVGTASSQSSTTTSFRSIFTVPASADASVPLLPNINDPQAVNAQDICPGYKASNVQRTPYGLTADLSLAGTACNVYGTDIDSLSLTGGSYPKHSFSLSRSISNYKQWSINPMTASMLRSHQRTLIPRIAPGTSCQRH